jgi:hypothetical protein
MDDAVLEDASEEAGEDGDDVESRGFGAHQDDDKGDDEGGQRRNAKCSLGIAQNPPKCSLGVAQTSAKGSHRIARFFVAVNVKLRVLRARDVIGCAKSIASWYRISHKCLN